MSKSLFLEQLATEFSEPVRDPLWGNIFLTPAFERLASSTPFAKLAGIKQLGPAYLVYPGATHTRYAHSLGVFNMARRILQSLVSRKSGLESLGFITKEGLDSFLAAALCHDLGHFPFAHSLKELPLEEHEALTARLMLAEPIRSLVGKAGGDPDLAAAIVDQAMYAGSEKSANKELRFFRGLLSGVLDPDKLDYLNRDAYFCGVPYGVQDTEFILQRLVLSGERMGIEERGLMSVEGVLFAKYLMYRSVYWHRGVRSATAMVKKAVFIGLRESAIAPEELYGLEDSGFVALLRSRSFKPFSLAEAALSGRAFQPLLDLPFDAGDPRHEALLDLEARSSFEEAIARRASALGNACDPLDLVLDIPEPVSFESDLPIVDGEGQSLPFSDSSTVFAPTVVAGFSRSLRRIRLLAARPGEGLLRAARESLA